MAYRPLLGHGFGEHEDHDDLERGGDRDADRAEHLCSYDADERGGNELEEQDEQQDRREECLGLLHEREDRRACNQDEDRHQQGAVGAGEASCRGQHHWIAPGSRWWAASSCSSSASIIAASVPSS